MVFDRGRRRRSGRRLIRDGDSYTVDEDREGRIELEEPDQDSDPPPVEIQGEPFGWTKGAPYPRGWREDEDYGPTYRDHNDPGPYDGSWDPPGEEVNRGSTTD